MLFEINILKDVFEKIFCFKSTNKNTFTQRPFHLFKKPHKIHWILSVNGNMHSEIVNIK